jgi:hypothetical protein
MDAPRSPRVASPVGVVYYRQADYEARLGDSSRITIAEAGCLLTSLTIAHNMLTHGAKLDPASANAYLERRGGFELGSAALETERAAELLGMEVTDRKALSGRNSVTAERAIDAALRKGGGVILGTDLGGVHRSSRVSDAGHFICIVKKNSDGTYLAADPLSGPVVIQPGADGAMHYKEVPAWKIVEMMCLWPVRQRGA